MNVSTGITRNRRPRACVGWRCKGGEAADELVEQTADGRVSTWKGKGLHPHRRAPSAPPQHGSIEHQRGCQSREGWKGGARSEAEVRVVFAKSIERVERRAKDGFQRCTAHKRSTLRRGTDRRGNTQKENREREWATDGQTASWTSSAGGGAANTKSQTQPACPYLNEPRHSQRCTERRTPRGDHSRNSEGEGENSFKSLRGERERERRQGQKRGTRGWKGSGGGMHKTTEKREKREREKTEQIHVRWGQWSATHRQRGKEGGGSRSDSEERRWGRKGADSTATAQPSNNVARCHPTDGKCGEQRRGCSMALEDGLRRGDAAPSAEHAAIVQASNDGKGERNGAAGVQVKGRRAATGGW